MALNENEKRIADQFSIRIKTYDTSAQWMMHPQLIEAHTQLLGGGFHLKKCLELCCGTGLVGRAIQKKNWSVTGIDLTPEMAEVANQHFQTVAGNVESSPFVSDSFDAAVLRQAFMLLDPEKSLAEIHRVLKPQGHFLLSQSVPFGAADDEQYQKIQWGRHINMKKYYNVQVLEQILETNGFEVTDTVFLSIEESVNKWLDNAPELTPELRKHIFGLIADAPAAYKQAHNVHFRNDELFENWNWVLIKSRIRAKHVGN